MASLYSEYEKRARNFKVLPVNSKVSQKMKNYDSKFPDTNPFIRGYMANFYNRIQNLEDFEIRNKNILVLHYPKKIEQHFDFGKLDANGKGNITETLYKNGKKKMTRAQKDLIFNSIGFLGVIAWLAKRLHKDALSRGTTLAKDIMDWF